MRSSERGEQRGDEVAGDELAGLVDEEAAVGVAVEGDAEVGAVVAHLAEITSSRFSGSSGLGSWPGKSPSGFQ